MARTALTNTNDGDAAPKARGRPRKQGKLKVTSAIASTGRGRGRPKKLETSREGLKIIIAKGTVITKTKQPKKSKGTTGKVGRPRKEKVSESEGDDDDEAEPRRPVGRPPTGAVNLNIVRTGRGQGRPKKSKTGDKLATKTQSSNNTGATRKPGRPSMGGMAYQPTGKPRGRPKAEKPVEREQQPEEDEDDASSLDI